MLSAEPHKLHFPGLSPSRAKPMHYTARFDKNARSYSINSTSAEAQSSKIIGNILIAKSANGSIETIFAILKQKLTQEGQASADLPSEQTPEDEPEHWIRKALHGLQAEGLVDKFDVGEFMTFAHAYAVRREEPEQPAPAMVVYPKLSKDHAKKARTNHFWVSYPMEAKPAPRNRVEGNNKEYGGLM